MSPFKKSTTLYQNAASKAASKVGRRSAPVQKKIVTAWDELSVNMKKDVKNWFISRARKAGIDWGGFVSHYTHNFDTLMDNFDKIEDLDVAENYPAYYLKTFHSYEEGNLNWEAAFDCLAATLSISANYYPGEPALLTAEWMRRNFTNTIMEHTPLGLDHRHEIKQIDLGASCGASSAALLEAFPQSHITSIDLSPHFLAVAHMNLRDTSIPLFTEDHERITLQHGLAEDTGLPKGEYDHVSMSFLLHEVPTDTARAIMREAYSLLKPGGVLSILELDAANLRALPQPRRYFFELTEPHIAAFCRNEVPDLVKEAGFDLVHQQRNDPINKSYIAVRPTHRQAAAADADTHTDTPDIRNVTPRQTGLRPGGKGPRSTLGQLYAFFQ